MNRLRSGAHLIALGVTSAVILYWLFPDIEQVTIVYNDAVSHLALLRMMDDTWARGGSITDFWLAHINFGHAFFRSYQFLMHLLIWTAHKTVLAGVSLERAFTICITIVAMAMPWTFFKGARLLGLTVFEATAAAIASTLIHESAGYGIGLTNVTYAGLGTYSQLFATVCFPIAIGLAHRMIREQRNPALPALAFAATFMCNIMTGYFAWLWITVDALHAVFAEKKDLKKTVLTLAKYGAVVLVVIAYWFIPMAQDSLLQHRSKFEASGKWTGIGAQQLLKDIVTGDMLDAGRVPVQTAVSLLGVVVCAAAFLGRRRKASGTEVRRLLLIQSVVWTLLSFGPETWGPIVKVFPFSGQLHWHRFFAGLEIALSLCAGIALAALWKWLNPEKRLENQMNRIAALALFAALLFPCLKERQEYFYHVNTYWLNDANKWWNDREMKFRELLDFALQHQDARYYPGHPWNWGNDLRITTYIPTYGLLAQYNLEVVGAIHHHQNHTEVLAFESDWKNPLHHELMNTRYVVLKIDEKPPAGFTELVRTVNSVLYDNGDRSGYFAVGTEANGGCIDNEALIRTVPRYLASPLVARHVYPTITFAKSCDSAGLQLETALPEIEKATSAVTLPGKITSSGKEPGPNSEVHWAKGRMEKPGVLLFKMNYHPGWVATVNGAPRPLTLVMPAFGAVRLEAGAFDVRLEYMPDGFKKSLLWMSLAGLIASLGWAWKAA